MELSEVFFAWYSSHRVLFVSLMAGVFTTVGFLVLSLIFNSGRTPLRRRLAEFSDEKGRQEPAPGLSERFIKGSGEALNEVQQQFIYAGFTSKKAYQAYYLGKLVLVLCLPGLLYLLLPLYTGLPQKQVLLFAFCAGALGFIVPGLVLDAAVRKRQRAIVDGVPDMLDLLVACSESGLGLNAALQRVAREISLSYPELARELDTVNLEIQAGADRLVALKRLGERTGVAELRGFVMMLRQSIRFGSGIADTLRIYSDEFRDARMQRAEEIAGKLATKMIFPLIFCIFPAFFVVALGPAALRLMEVFSG
ncbi:type II secretion system F family protein [Granulosicoccaceae sp. 1_MG-2023]|nr:type II secretion system F family protein [Granulosicoccaceae sp. 1_MG-2023]